MIPISAPGTDCGLRTTDYGLRTTDYGIRTTKVKTGLLVIAHGSRQDEANGDLHQIVAEMRRRGRYPIVEPGFLELTEPAIETAAERCVEQGARRIILLPYFLSAGVHVR